MVESGKRQFLTKSRLVPHTPAKFHCPILLIGQKTETALQYLAIMTSVHHLSEHNQNLLHTIQMTKTRYIYCFILP